MMLRHIFFIFMLEEYARVMCYLRREEAGGADINMIQSSVIQPASQAGPVPIPDAQGGRREPTDRKSEARGQETDLIMDEPGGEEDDVSGGLTATAGNTSSMVQESVISPPVSQPSSSVSIVLDAQGGQERTNPTKITSEQPSAMVSESAIHPASQLHPIEAAQAPAGQGPTDPKITETGGPGVGSGGGTTAGDSMIEINAWNNFSESLFGQKKQQPVLSQSYAGHLQKQPSLLPLLTGQTNYQGNESKSSGIMSSQSDIPALSALRRPPSFDLGGRGQVVGQDPSTDPTKTILGAGTTENKQNQVAGAEQLSTAGPVEDEKPAQEIAAEKLAEVLALIRNLRLNREGEVTIFENKNDQKSDDFRDHFPKIDEDESNDQQNSRKPVESWLAPGSPVFSQKKRGFARLAYLGKYLDWTLEMDEWKHNRYRLGRNQQGEAPMSEKEMAEELVRQFFGEEAAMAPSFREAASLQEVYDKGTQDFFPTLRDSCRKMWLARTGEDLMNADVDENTKDDATDNLDAGGAAASVEYGILKSHFRRCHDKDGWDRWKDDVRDVELGQIRVRLWRLPTDFLEAFYKDRTSRQELGLEGILAFFEPPTIQPSENHLRHDNWIANDENALSERREQDPNALSMYKKAAEDAREAIKQFREKICKDMGDKPIFQPKYWEIIPRLTDQELDDMKMTSSRFCSDEEVDHWRPGPAKFVPHQFLPNTAPPALRLFNSVQLDSIELKKQETVLRMIYEEAAKLHTQRSWYCRQMWGARTNTEFPELCTDENNVSTKEEEKLYEKYCLRLKTCFEMPKQMILQGWTREGLKKVKDSYGTGLRRKNQEGLHQAYEKAIKSLAKDYLRPPEWVEQYMKMKLLYGDDHQVSDPYIVSYLYDEDRTNIEAFNAVNYNRPPEIKNRGLRPNHLLEEPRRGGEGVKGSWLLNDGDEMKDPEQFTAYRVNAEKARKLTDDFEKLICDVLQNSYFKSGEAALQEDEDYRHYVRLCSEIPSEKIQLDKERETQEQLNHITGYYGPKHQF